MPSDEALRGEIQKLLMTIQRESILRHKDCDICIGRTDAYQEIARHLRWILEDDDAR